MSHCFSQTCLQVQEYQYLKVNYESVVDWKLTTDHLCCNPRFHGCERCDCALVRTQDKDRNNKNILVHILFMFKQSISSQTLDLTLVQPMGALMGPQHAVDWDLRLRRLRAWPLALTEFITLHSVIVKVVLKWYQIWRASASAHMLCPFPKYSPVFQNTIGIVSKDLDGYRSVSEGPEDYRMVSGCRDKYRIPIQR
jgi:hypothetical protein